MKRAAVLLATIVIVTGLTPSAQARIKLVSLPERARVVLRLDNPDAVLVEEERVVTLQRGVNRIDFSWQRVSIEPGSIRLEPLEQAGRVDVVNVSFPPEENALVWEVESGVSGPVRLRISYLLKGIRRLVSYRAVANAGETALTLRGYLTLQNYSGESFDEIVIEPGYGESFTKRLEHGESKQMLSFAVAEVPIEKTFTYDPAKHGERTVVKYTLKNAAESKLGAFALPAGKVRLFIADAESGAAFLGEDFAELTPVGGELELLVGDARDISVEHSLVEAKKVPRLREQDGRITLYDSDETYRYELQNFRSEAVTLTVVAHVNDTWQMVRSSHTWEKTDSRTVEFTVELPPNGRKVTLEYQVRRLNLQ